MRVLVASMVLSFAGGSPASVILLGSVAQMGEVLDQSGFRKTVEVLARAADDNMI